MRTQIITIGLVALVLCLCPITKGADKTFDSNGQILPGETWDTVYVRNNGTVVDMSGGQIGSQHSFGGLITSDSSIFNMSGGQIIGYSSGFNSIFINDSSTFNVSGGTIDMYMDFVVYGSANANISGGNVTAGRLKTSFSSTVNITGGSINLDMLDVFGGGRLTISRGLLTIDDTSIGNNSVIDVYGYDFNYDPSKMILTGRLLDGNQLNISGLDSLEYQRFNLIPEPSSLLLIGFGLLMIKPRRK